MIASLTMQNDRLDDCLRLRTLYEDKLKSGPYPTSEVTPARFPEPAPGNLHMYLADIAGIASHGEKLLGLEGIRRDQFRTAVAESFAERWPQISQQISPNETPKLHRLMDDTEEARILIKKVLGD
jgi:hypothetical protein